MYVILNDEPLEEVDFLSNWGRKWQLMEDWEECGTENEWGV